MLILRMSLQARECNTIRDEAMSYNYQDFQTNAPWIDTLGPGALQAL